MKRLVWLCSNCGTRNELWKTKCACGSFHGAVGQQVFSLIELDERNVERKKANYEARDGA